jgi:hypothetical protein
MKQLSGPSRCWNTDQGLGEHLTELGVHPMPNHPITPLARGRITNHDEICVMLVEPPDGTPAFVSVQWPTPAKC